ILKLSSDGSKIIYSTYLGGSASDSAFGIALDSSNNAYVSGHTTSSDFPTTTGANDTTHDADHDAFIVKLSADGSTLLYSTLVGGGGDDRGWGIVLDSANNAYVAGSTNMMDFPSTPGAKDTSHNGGWDPYVLKLSADGSTIIYSTFIGGSLDDTVTGIAIDSLNNTYITGTTYDPSFNVTPDAYDTSHNGANDGYILKLSSDGSTKLYSTYFGGNDDDYSYAIALDELGNAYVTGRTSSSNFPTTSRAYDNSYNLNWDTYILKLSNDGTTLLYSSYIGHFDEEVGNYLAVDSSMNVYLTGYTWSVNLINNFPTVLGSYDRTYNGANDIFVMKVGIEDPILDILTPTVLQCMVQ
ncbi:MAG: SBBP repeat-containing protein, partial [Candidatus Thorarchaeota archaeon]|nr:SBBP repeat-containing protein [Candidatus Thorarchaeota archaeon]